MSPPPLFKTSELRWANKILRLATNSFDTNSVYQLHLLGGPKLPRPLAYLVACITRASLKTLTGFEEQHKTLVDTVYDNECLANSFKCNAIPNGWDSAAFCSNLLCASSGDLAEFHFPGSMAGILQIKRKFRNKTLKVSLQKAIFEHLTASVPPSFAKVFADRFSKALNIGIELADIFKAPTLTNFSSRINTCCRPLPSSSHPQLALLRTWSNGWFTSHRVHAENDGGVRLPCIFGCEDEPDSLSHYITCDPLWTLVFSASRADSSILQSATAHKLCLIDPSPESVARCVIAYQSYHALRNTYSNVIDDAVSSFDFTPLVFTACEVMCEFAESIGLR